MKRFLLSLACAPLFLSIGLAEAPPTTEETPLSKEFTSCLAKATATVEMLDCMAAENTQQDARLNTVYKKLMEKLPKERKEKLKEAQRAWLKFRDAQTNYLASAEGTAASLTSADWLLQSTIARTKQLEDQLEMVELQ